MREGKKKFNGAADDMDIIVLGSMDVDNDDVTYLKTVKSPRAAKTTPAAPNTFQSPSASTS